MRTFYQNNTAYVYENYKFFSFLNVLYFGKQFRTEITLLFVLQLYLHFANILTWVFILIAPMDGIS